MAVADFNQFKKTARLFGLTCEALHLLTCRDQGLYDAMEEIAGLLETVFPDDFQRSRYLDQSPAVLGQITEQATLRELVIAGQPQPVKEHLGQITPIPHLAKAKPIKRRLMA